MNHLQLKSIFTKTVLLHSLNYKEFNNRFQVLNKNLHKLLEETDILLKTTSNWITESFVLQIEISKICSQLQVLCNSSISSQSDILQCQNDISNLKLQVKDIESSFGNLLYDSDCIQTNLKVWCDTKFLSKYIADATNRIMILLDVSRELHDGESVQYEDGQEDTIKEDLKLILRTAQKLSKYLWNMRLDTGVIAEFAEKTFEMSDGVAINNLTGGQEVGAISLDSPVNIDTYDSHTKIKNILAFANTLLASNEILLQNFQSLLRRASTLHTGVKCVQSKVEMMLEDSEFHRSDFKLLYSRITDLIKMINEIPTNVDTYSVEILSPIDEQTSDETPGEDSLQNTSPNPIFKVPKIPSNITK